MPGLEIRTRKRKEDERRGEEPDSKKKKTQEEEDWESDFWNNDDIASSRDIGIVERAEIIERAEK
eukprot:10015467-Karenia_brevis.AAC.1